MDGHSASALMAVPLLGCAPALPASADTVMFTGANSGLGLELVKQYAATRDMFNTSTPLTRTLSLGP
jgi:hypothetical protein